MLLPCQVPSSLSSGEGVSAAGTTSHLPPQQLEPRVTKHTAGPPMAQSLAVPLWLLSVWSPCHHHSYLLQRHLLPVATLGASCGTWTGLSFIVDGLFTAQHGSENPARSTVRPRPPTGFSAPRAVTEGCEGDSPAALDTWPSSLSPECHSHTGPRLPSPPGLAVFHCGALQAARESTLLCHGGR